LEPVTAGLLPDFATQPFLVQAGRSRDGLQEVQLTLGRGVLRREDPSRAFDLLSAAAVPTAGAGDVDRRIHHAAGAGAELKIRAELGTIPERRQGAADGLGLRLFDVIAEVARLLTPPTRGGAAGGK